MSKPKSEARRKTAAASSRAFAEACVGGFAFIALVAVTIGAILLLGMVL